MHRKTLTDSHRMTLVNIRPFQSTDLDAIFQICLRTGWRGGDATGHYSDPRLLGHFYAAPYVKQYPGLCLVATLDGVPSGYILGTADSVAPSPQATGTTGKEDYGVAVRIPNCGHTLLMNQRIMKFDALRRDIIDDGYLLHYLRSRCFLDILYPTANGTRQANLSSVTMKLLPVPLTSLKEQKAIAAKLDALSEQTQRLARLSERKLAALEALTQSPLHPAFTGQL